MPSIGRVVLAISLLVGLGAVLAEPSSSDIDLEHFVNSFNLHKRKGMKIGNRAAELLTSAVGIKSGPPLELEQIKQQVQEKGLAWFNTYEQELRAGAWRKREYAEALIKTYEQIYAESINSFEAEVNVPRMKRSCRYFYMNLEPVFDRSRLEAMRSSKLESLLRHEIARTEVAEFVLGWAQYLTCKSLDRTNGEELKQLEGNIHSLLDARDQPSYIAAAARRQQEDPHKIVSISPYFTSYMDKVSSKERELVEYFYDCLIKRREKNQDFAEALESLEPGLLAPFLDSVDKFKQQSDAKAILDTLRHDNARLVAGYKYEEPEDDSISNLPPVPRLSLYTEASLEKACSKYAEPFNRFFGAEELKGAKMAQWIAGTPKVMKLAEPERNKLRILLRHWARYHACESLRALSNDELKKTIRKLGLIKLSQIQMFGLN